MQNLKDKKAVVTGGNSGIGYATAKLLKEQGASVVITGRDAEKVRAAAAELGVTGIVADSADVAALGKLTETVKTQMGEVDILFLNAGVFYPTPLGQIDEAAFDKQMAINFKGAVFTLEKFLPLLKDGASVINLSSVNAYTGMPNTAVYAASKAAMNSFTRTAATELAPRKIRVNAVNPGLIDTQIARDVVNGDIEAYAAMENGVPIGRAGRPEEIAAAVLWLCSPGASYVVGHALTVDGGLTVV